MSASAATGAAEEWLADAERLLTELRAAGYAIGTGETLRALAVLEQLRAAGVTPGPEEAAGWLAPVICRSEAEQAALAPLLRAFAAAQARRTSAPRPMADRPSLADVVLGRQEPVPRVVRATSPRWRVLVPSLAVGAGLLLVAWFLLTGGVDTPTGPAPSAGADGQGDRLAVFLATTMLWLIAPLDELRFALPPLMLWLIWIRLRRPGRPVLERIRAPEGQAARQVAVGAHAVRAFAAPALRGPLQGLRTHRFVEGGRIDARRSVRATLAAAGRPRLLRARRPRLPDYPVVVEALSRADHVTALAGHLVARLREERVEATLYAFGDDPRRLRGPAGIVALDELRLAHGHEALILFGDGGFLWDAAEGRPRALATELLATWDRVVLLTPLPLARWSWRERELTLAGVVLLPATPEGLLLLGGFMRAGGEPPRPALDLPPARPGLLDSDAPALTGDLPPAEADRAAILAAVTRALPRDAFRLAAVLALFPEIRVDLTLAALAALAPRAEREEVLGALAALPWFRHGRMPDWLRLDLARTLRPAAREEAARFYAAWLAGAEAEAGGQLELVVDTRGIFAELRRRLARQQAPARLRDTIFLSFSRDELLDALDLEAPPDYARLLRPDWRSPERVGLLVAGVVAAGLVALEATLRISAVLGASSTLRGAADFWVMVGGAPVAILWHVRQFAAGQAWRRIGEYGLLGCLLLTALAACGLGAVSEYFLFGPLFVLLATAPLFALGLVTAPTVEQGGMRRPAWGIRAAGAALLALSLAAMPAPLLLDAPRGGFAAFGTLAAGCGVALGLALILGDWPLRAWRSAAGAILIGTWQAAPLIAATLTVGELLGFATTIYHAYALAMVVPLYLGGYAWLLVWAVRPNATRETVWLLGASGLVILATVTIVSFAAFGDSFAEGGTSAVTQSVPPPMAMRLAALPPLPILLPLAPCFLLMFLLVMAGTDGSSPRRLGVCIIGYAFLATLLGLLSALLLPPLTPLLPVPEWGSDVTAATFERLPIGYAPTVLAQLALIPGALALFAAGPVWWAARREINALRDKPGEVPSSPLVNLPSLPHRLPAGTLATARRAMNGWLLRQILRAYLPDRPAEPPPDPLAAVRDALAAAPPAATGTATPPETTPEIRLAAARAVAASDPAAEPKLLEALGQHAAQLAGEERLEEAAPVQEEGVAVARRLAERDPAGFRSTLASWLLGLGSTLNALDRLPQARDAAREAVELLRGAEAERDMLQRHHALTLLGGLLQRMGDVPGARSAFEEAVQAAREDSRRSPLLGGFALLQALMALAGLGEAIGDELLASGAAREAAAVAAGLAAQDPGSQLPAVVGALSSTATRFARLRGMENEGRRLAEAAVSLARTAPTDAGSPGRPPLLTALRAMGEVLDSIGDTEAAVAVAAELVAVARSLSAGDPLVEAEALADAAWLHRRRGDLEPARARYAEAVELLRAAPARPRHRRLADLLQDLASMHAQGARIEEAIAAQTEAIAILRSGSRDTRGATALTGALTRLADFQEQAGRRAEAVSALEESVALLQQAASQRGDAGNLDLMRALVRLSEALEAIGNTAGALERASAAAALARRIADGMGTATGPSSRGWARGLAAEALDRHAMLLLRDGAAALAAEQARQAIEVLRPIFLAEPADHAWLMARLLDRYEAACHDARLTPDHDLIAKLRSLLPPHPEPQRDPS